jgi:hypothetical protein
MPGTRDHLDHIDEPGVRLATPRTADHEQAPAVAGRSDPRLAHPAASAASLMHLQQTVGNAAVSALMAPAVQRSVEIGKVDTNIESAPDAAPGPAGTAPAAGSPVTSDGGGTTITGPTITLDAAMTRANGVLRADTIIADTVVAANYTPGAGNLY